MKRLIFIFLLLTSILCHAQLTLEQKDLTRLIAISELCSKNPMYQGADFSKSIDSLRTPRLNHLADVLITTGKGDRSILKADILKRPSDDELVMWYVIREIHYNNVNKKQSPRPAIEVAHEVLASKTDSRALLDNYYYRIHGGIATLFNNADLSNENFNLEELGFHDDTEKAIFFFGMMEGLVGPRFKVLQFLKNNKKILDFADKLPKFNGHPYFYYKNFDFPDFEWMGYDEVKSYKNVQIGTTYSTLIAHLSALAELKKKKTYAQELYSNSILNEPKYFKYSDMKTNLQSLYDNSK